MNSYESCCCTVCTTLDCNCHIVKYGTVPSRRQVSLSMHVWPGTVSAVRGRRAQVGDHLGVPTQRFVVLRADVQLKPVGVLHVRASWRALLGALWHKSRLERAVRHHLVRERINPVGVYFVVQAPPPHVAVDVGYAQVRTGTPGCLALARWAGRSGVQIAGVENAGVENARVR